MAQITLKKSSLSINPSQIRKLFYLSNNLADMTEELLDENNQYSEEFVSGLKQAEQNFKAGRIKKIKSLRELSK